jgi:hypothetical protein
MLCALTIRTLKPGTFEQLREAFMRHEDLESPPAGYVPLQHDPECAEP